MSSRTIPRRTHASASSSSSSTRSSDALGDDFADFSPASEALSLTEDDEEMYEEGPEELGEEYDFEPKAGDAVWVKSNKTERETWYFGHVQKSTKLGTVRGGKQGTFYMVRYRQNLRRYFAPLLGEIKPNTLRVRTLLKEAGYEMEQ